MTSGSGGTLGRPGAFGNLVTALLFTAAHCPGWAFRGDLAERQVSFADGAPSVFLLGFLFGWVAHRARSLSASTLVHAIGNLAAS